MFYLPFLIYWTSSIITFLFSRTRKSLEDRKNNSVHPLSVFYDVFFSTFLSLPTYYLCDIYLFEKTGSIYNIRWWYLLFGVWLVDTFEYIFHYSCHYFPVLYRNIHSVHHQIRNTYSYGALYQSMSESLIEMVGLMYLFFYCSFFYEEFIIVMSMAVFAGVLEHTTPNSFHYIHHSSHPNSNFQTPFFTYYDHLFGTHYKPCE